MEVSEKIYISGVKSKLQLIKETWMVLGAPIDRNQTTETQPAPNHSAPRPGSFSFHFYNIRVVRSNLPSDEHYLSFASPDLLPKAQLFKAAFPL